MCIFNRLTVNPRKIFSPFYREQYLVSFKCGKCVECQQQLANEWYYRSLYEYKCCVNSGGYMLFDTLTYKRAPRISDFISIPRSLDYMCFSYRDVRLFLVLLRKHLERMGYDVKHNLRYFISSEYGTDDRYTHRPHYHVLFYVYNNFIDYQTLSNEIADCWIHGRTDGVKYKGAFYVKNNNVISSGISSSSRVCKYVSKYVMKDIGFQQVIDSRINALMWHLFQKDVRFDVIRDFASGCAVEVTEFRDYDSFSSWIKSPNGRQKKAELTRLLSQFHRQSLGYGLYALQSLDIDKLMVNDIVTVEDASQRTVMRLPLPMYYKRKLFYDVVKYQGVKMWQLNRRGKIYKNKRDMYLCEFTKRQLLDFRLNTKFTNINFDADKIARYMIYERGRINGDITAEVTIDDKKHLPCNIYNYVTVSDLRQFHCKGLSFKWLGSSGQYLSSFASFTPLQTFINRYVIFNKVYEDIIDEFYRWKFRNGEKKQELLEYKQRLSLLYKGIFPHARQRRA